jgi:putative copper export protein
MQFVYWVLLSIHVLASAAWFGAMLYSLVVLHPRARAFFGDAKRFEEFIAFIAAGARWKVLGGCLLIGLTGAALMFFPSEQHRSTAWQICIAVKTILLLAAMGIFCFASWKLWPARILCSPEEIPKFQRQFRIVAVTLLVLVGMAMVLGVVGSHFQ